MVTVFVPAGSTGKLGTAFTEAFLLIPVKVKTALLFVPAGTGDGRVE
jgi:hypothetical protein